MIHDDAYANAPYIPGADDYPPRWQAQARAFRTTHAPRGIRYGVSARQVCDVFQPAGPAQGLAVFVHGGFWRRFDGSVWSHLAAGALARGWAMAIPSYDLCPDVRIADITAQIACALETLAAQHPGPIAICGHSAGGHLVARMLAPGVLTPETAARLVSCVPISPLGDLRPLIHTAMNADFRLDDASARAESPVFMPTRLPVPCAVWVGGDERPAFLDQARGLGVAFDCPVRVAPGRHHFNVIDALAHGDSALLDDLLGGHASQR